MFLARHVAVALAVSLLLVPAGVVADVPDARLTVSAATVAPETPVVGEQVTVTVTVANSAGSQSAVAVDDLRLTDGDRQVARATGVGTLSPGDSVTVPLAATFDAAGPRVLTLSVVGTDAEDRTVRVTRPVPVVVEAAPPLVELALPGAAVDRETRLAVSLSNPTTAPLRNVVVAANESTGRAVVDRRTLPTLAAGAATTLNLSVVPAEPGDRTASVDVTYTTASGVSRTLTAARTVTVDPFVDDVGLSVLPVRPEETSDAEAGGLGGLLGGLGGAAGVAGGGAVTTGGDEAAADPLPTRYEVTVTNFGTVPAERVVLAPATANGSLPRVGLSEPLNPGESTTAILDLSTLGTPATVTLDATYRAGVREGAANATFRHAPAVADVRLTDVDAVREDGRLRLTGNVANLGDADLSGVVVTAVATADVTPAFPQRDYFVGSLGGSDFAPFELTAVVNESADEVPVRVGYRVDGERVERVVTVPLDEESEDDGGALAGALGGASLPAVGLGVALVAVAGLGVGLLRAGSVRSLASTATSAVRRARSHRNGRDRDADARVSNVDSRASNVESRTSSPDSRVAPPDSARRGA